MGSCFANISKLARESLPKETGSILVGHYTTDGRVATIVDISPMASDSTSTHSTYVRGTNGVQSYYQELQRKSKGRFHFVGEWHTHPFASPEPSICDRRTLMQIAKSGSIGCTSPLLLILGYEMRKQIEVGLFWHHEKQLERLTCITADMKG